MDKISKNDLDTAPPLPELEEEKAVVALEPEEFIKLLDKMKNPVELQKELAVKLKHFLDHQIKKEMEETGMLTDYTRRWIKDYNDVLDKIQKSLHGDTKVNLHVGKVTHAHVAAKIRKYKNITPKEELDETTSTD